MREDLGYGFDPALGSYLFGSSEAIEKERRVVLSPELRVLFEQMIFQPSSDSSKLSV